MRRTAWLALPLLACVTGSAAAQDTPPRDTGLRVSARAGMLGSTVSSGTWETAPALGLGVSYAPHPVLGVSLRWDGAYASRGTSFMTTQRYAQLATALVDARWRLTPALSLVGSVGGGASLLVARTQVESGGSMSTFATRGTLALATALEFDLSPRWRAGLTANGWLRSGGTDVQGALQLGCSF